MSQQIPTSMVNQFSSNVYHLSQQKDARIWPLLRRKEQIQGESKFFDRIGLTDVNEKVSRHSDVTFNDTPYTRRRITMRDYYWADLVDKEDKLRIIHNPESEYSMAFRAAFARKMDSIAIAALLGTVYTGKEGATAVVLPDTQKIASVASSNFSQMNIETLRFLKYKFDSAEVEDNDRHLIVGASELRALLNDEKITNADYAAVKALVNGEINSFMGFNFHRSELLPFTTATQAADDDTGVVSTGGGDTISIGAKRCVAFAGSAAIAGIGVDVTARVTERPDKHYANQVYMNMSLGAMRMEEVKVVEILVTQV